MTLKELRALVQNNKEETAPSYEQLRFGNIPIVACGKHSTGDITVYQNGFVLYTESNHYTIFHIDTVYNKSKQYLTVDEKTVPERLRTIEASVFWDLDWIIRLVMEGNERIIHNNNCAENKLIEFHYSEFSEDMEELCYTPGDLEEKALFEKMCDELVEKVRSKLLPKQWVAYVKIEVHGLSEQELAEELKVSQQAVSRCYARACERILRVKADVERKMGTKKDP